MGEAVEGAQKALIDRLPKAELHVHLEGAAEVETLLHLARRNGIALDRENIVAARRPRGYRSFDLFARAFLMTVRCLRGLDDFAELAYRHGAAMQRQNIRYAEITWTPQLYGHLRLPMDAILEALNAGRARARQEWGVEMRWIPDLVRSFPGPALKVQAWAVSPAARDGGVVALGLGGPEGEDLEPDIREAFARARAAGLPANPHAGEGAGPRSVWLALRELGALRIGHGVRAIEDAELLRHLAERQVTLEVCPSSNVLLQIFPSYADHPLKRLLAAGCRVTINSDDPALFGSDLCGEYAHAVADCGITLQQVKDSILTAVDSSHLPAAEKQGLRQDFEAEMARLEREAEVP
ncbi:MAG: adenosine deaminase [Kiloniellaceae bacterium]